MFWVPIFAGLLIAGFLLSTLPRATNQAAKVAASAGAVVALVLGFALASVRFVPEDKLGVVVRNALGASLPPGRIIATNGEMGPQAAILPPGWHLGYWPIVFDLELYDVLRIEAGQVGLITTADGLPLPEGQIYAQEWSEDTFQSMLDAQRFLTEGKGYKGPQASVLTPGTYRLNPKLYMVTTVPETNIPPASVGVVKSNVGTRPVSGVDQQLVEKGQRGIWRERLDPAKYYLNTSAYEVTVISTKATIVQFTASLGKNDEREISVRSFDGFTFPVDVRVEYLIEPKDAPLVVASLKDDKDSLQNVLNSAVRAIFRNNAERVKAMDYVQQRSQQERQSLELLVAEMEKYGVTITAVRIGDVGNEQTLGLLLKTQTDREIAKQEQLTFQEQERAAEQKKALSRTQQEAEEERRLATATYQVKIAEEAKRQRVIEASAEAEAIRVKAEAQANAYKAIAQQIGSGNAALVELLRIVGENNINITPRVMVSGAAGSDSSSQTVALIGTMLDRLVADSPQPSQAPVTSAARAEEP